MKGNAIQSFRISEIPTVLIATSWCLIVAGALFAVILKLNTLTPYGAEDYALMLSPIVQTASILGKAYHVLERIVVQFLLWNSRIGDQLAIVFLASNKAYFNLFNSLMFLILVFLLEKMNNIVRETGLPEPKIVTTAIWLVAFSIIILLFPALGEVFFWLTGSTNYLWSIVVLLTFFYRYWDLTLKNPKTLSGSGRILLILHGLLAGLTNENIVPVVILLIGVVLYDLHRRRVDLRQLPWPVWGWGALITGYCILVFSSSTRIRLAYFKHTLAIPDPSVSLYWNRLLAITARW